MHAQEFAFPTAAAVRRVRIRVVESNPETNVPPHSRCAPRPRNARFKVATGLAPDAPDGRCHVSASISARTGEIRVYRGADEVLPYLHVGTNHESKDELKESGAQSYWIQDPDWYARNNLPPSLQVLFYARDR